MRYSLIISLALAAACSSSELTAPDRADLTVSACTNLIDPAVFRVTYNHDGSHIPTDTTGPFQNRFTVPLRTADTVRSTISPNVPGSINVIFTFHPAGYCETLLDSLSIHYPYAVGAVGP